MKEIALLLLLILTLNGETVEEDGKNTFTCDDWNMYKYQEELLEMADSWLDSVGVSDGWNIEAFMISSFQD